MEALREETIQVYANGKNKWNVYSDGERIGSISFETNWGRTPTYVARRAKEDDSYRDDYISGDHKTLYAAKIACVEDSHNCVENRKPKFKIYDLPAGDNSDFYPTPTNLIGKMFASVNWDKVKSVLEPSAGSGNIVDALNALGKTKYRKYNSEMSFDVDCIEIDQNLRYILQGKAYRVVHDDFLTYNTRKQYDVIVMNPPFSQGDQHLLKAIDMQRNGGQIICLLNAETLRNPYTNSRHLLVDKLQSCGAKIQYLQNAFARSERPSNVEIAVVYVNIAKDNQMDSEFFTRMKEAHNHTSDTTKPRTDLTSANLIERMVREFEIETDATLKFINEFQALTPHIQNGESDYARSIIGIKIGEHNYDGGKSFGIDNEAINNYMRCVRRKYWSTLLEKPEITGKLTSNLQSEYRNSVEKMSDYDFSMFNIEQIIVAINSQIIDGVQAQIMQLFDTLSAEHAWYDECKNNIHYYNGWKTNKAHKVGMKVILPINGFSSYSWDKNKLDVYNIGRIVCDLEKTFDYLDGKRHEGYVDAARVLRNLEYQGQTKDIEFKYWIATFYKKGTMHIRFKDERIVDALNIYAGRQRAWLPPHYGKMHYSDMPEEAQSIIDEFQGREAYEQVMQCPHDYLIGASDFAALTAGD